MKKPHSNGEPCQDCRERNATRIYCSPNDSYLLLCESCISQRRFRDSMQEAETGVVAKINPSYEAKNI
jgi:hypothetical protein